MKKFTNNKEMVRSAKTRFATGFLTLKRFQEEKRHLLRFFASEEWHESKFSKEMVGNKIQKCLGETFWRNTTDILKIGGPLLTVLRMVDDLVYIKYNRALKRRYRLSGTVDLIALDDIDEANEWLTSEPERSSSDSTVVIDGDDDDYDNDLAGIDVGVDEADEVDYNLRA